MSAIIDSAAVPPELPPSRSERLAMRILQAGVIVAVFAATTHRTFELDRFLVAKELVLHLTAFFATLFALGALRRMKAAGVDRLLVAWLVLGAVSAIFATNPWLGFRALAVTISAAMVFWTARSLRGAGLAGHLLRAVALAVVLAAVTSLLQAYGLRTELFSINRAPGGTLGNRNFVGHAAAFGAAVVFLSALRARTRGAYLLACTGSALVVAALVLTRSRAAWLAFAVVLAVTILAVLISPALRRDGMTWRRLSGLAIFAIAATALALVIPNTLRWRSDNPYIESISNVAEYQEGSGHGRLVQYERSLRMTLGHPILGVGPGNWPVVYPQFARRNDPSLNDGEPGTTFNPWPSSDWIAYVSERGPVAAAVLAFAFVLLIGNALRRLRMAADPDEALQAAAMLGAIAGAGITGAFDAVLLLGMPALLVWTSLGALYEPRSERRSLSWLVIVPLLALTAAAVFRSGSQIAAMDLYTQGGRRNLELAAKVDPGNYRVLTRLARNGRRDERCAHARSAVALFPNSAAARDAARDCR